MIILIDTNIFYNNWFLSNANFKYLFNYLENSNSTLVLPNVICAEVDGKFRSEKAKIESQLNADFSKLLRFNKGIFLKKLPKVKNDYSFEKEILNNTTNVVFIPFDSVSNSVLVRRAIDRTRPFGNEDKGFRDSLIWLSFIKYLKSNDVKGGVAFINNNPTDFFDKTKTKLHSDLLRDLETQEIPNNFKIYLSLKEFIDSIVDKEHIKYTAEQIMDDFINDEEREIEEQIAFYINTRSEKWFITMLEESNSELKNITFMSGIDFVIHEGIEDPEILNWSLTDDNNLYIELYLNLRIVEMRFDIPTSDFLDFQRDSRVSFIDSEEDGDRTSVSIFKRPHFNISFNYSTDQREISDLVINSIEIS